MERPALHTPRKSLTKSQLQDPAALELLALLQTVTSDGRLLEEEVQLLNQWLASNRDSAIPAAEHLRTSVEAVLSDGRVTPEERAWLQKAVETVLPKEERDLAALRRREARADERRQAAEEKERLAELQRLNQPISTFDVMVAGVLHEGRAAVVERFVSEADTVYLAREPHNRFSPNAIAVRLASGRDIGFVPETEAVRLAPHLDQGALHSAAVKKILHGSRAPIPVIWGELYSPRAQLADAVTQAQVPKKFAAPHAPSTSPAAVRTEPTVPVSQASPSNHPARAASSSIRGSVWAVLVLGALALLFLWFR